MNLNYKILIMAALLVFYTSGSLYFIANYSLRKNLKEQILTDLGERAKVKIRSIDRFIQQRQSDIQMAAQNPILRSRDSYNTAELNALLLSLTKINSLYYSYSFFDTNRIRIADSKGLSVGEKHSYSKYWKEIDFKNPKHNFILDFSLSESIGKVVLHSACIVYGYNGKPTGLIVSRVLVDRLFDVFIEKDESLRKLKAKIDLLDEKGIYLYSSQTRKNVFGKAYKEIPVFSVLGSKTSAQYEADKKLYLVEKDRGYLNYIGSGFVLIFNIPIESAFLPLQKLEENLSIVLILTLLISGFISLIVTRVITRPLISLTKTAQEIANGNLNASFIIKSKDEFQTLGLQLQKMARTLRQRLEQQTNMADELLFKNKQITDSIRYAKGIQDTFLPNETLWNKHFKGHFILNLPKDIIGGDFYYLQEQKGKVVWIVGDCTGHGVPGALMVMQSHNALVQLIEIEGTTDPELLLAKLEKKLMPKGNFNGENDLFSGMDIGICVFDINENRLDFSGIGLDLIVYENAILKRIKGKRRNLASFVQSEQSPLNTHHLDYKSGTRFFMTSDGIKDQIGGEKRKKLMMRGFENQLRHMQEKTIDFQGKNLKSFMMNWMAFEPQLDDILVIGIEV